jgi:hypothetical protein
MGHPLRGSVYSRLDSPIVGLESLGSTTLK